MDTSEISETPQPTGDLKSVDLSANDCPKNDDNPNEEIKKEENNHYQHSETDSSDEEYKDIKKVSIADEENKEKQEIHCETEVQQQYNMQQAEIQNHSEHNENSTEHELLQINQEPCGLEKDVESDKIITEPLIKLNGNHTIPINDDNSCSSTTSSASSHNLVIDHPLAEEQLPVNTQQENCFTDVQITNASKSLKRKLSPCDGNDTPQLKQILLEPIGNPLKEDEEDQEENPVISQEQRNLVDFENQKQPSTSSSYIWESSKESTNFDYKEPHLTNPSYPIQSLDQHEAVQGFPKPTHVHIQEPNSVTLKEKPPPSSDLYTETQSFIEAPSECLQTRTSIEGISSQTFGPYPVYTGKNIPPTQFVSEVSHFGLMHEPAVPDSQIRRSTITSLKEPSSLNYKQLLPQPLVDPCTQVSSFMSLKEPSFVREIAALSSKQPTASSPEDPNSRVGPIVTTITSTVTTTIVKETNQSIGSYDLYTTPTGMSLPSPNLNFKCFKCKNSVFENFSLLREHQKICLFRKSPKQPQAQSPSLIPEAIAKSAKEKTVNLMNSPGPVEPTSSVTTPQKHFYFCSSCGTYHENWNLFLHIREIHNRHVCLYCIRLFPTAEKLSLHLEIKHDLEQNHFNSEEKLRSVSKSDGNSRFLMCCTCQHVFSEHEKFSDHVCTEYIQPCSLCGQKGRHLSNCKANPEKRAKVKRKSKAIAAAPHSNPPAPSVPVVPAPPVATVPKVICKIPKQIIPPYLTSAGQAFGNKSNNNINNHQMASPTLPITMHSMSTAPIPGSSAVTDFPKQNGYSDTSGIGYLQTNKPSSQDFNYNSDDSTNMVIDETCSTNNYSQMPTVNPFKVLDERERQDAVQNTPDIKSTLPPDRVPETIPEPKPLIVPKLRLCVPREFQKAVDMEISSSDSNEDEDLEYEEDLQNINLSTHSSVNETNKTRDNNNSSSTDDKDSGKEDVGDQLNSKLDRIIRQIQETQSEIRRAKQKLIRNSPEVVAPPTENHTPNEVPQQFLEPVIQGQESQSIEPVLSEVPEVQKSVDEVPEEVQEQSEPGPSTASYVSDLEPISNLSSMVDNEPLSWTTPERGTYSPTPPASPDSIWPSPSYQAEVEGEGEDENENENESESESKDVSTAFQAVSEQENIENIEKECVLAKVQSPDTDKMNSSSELDIESIQNQEDSTMDIEEKSKQTPPLSSPLEVMDFSAIPTAETEKQMQLEGQTQPASEIDDEDEEIEVVKEYVPPPDGIEVANDDVMITDLQLDRSIEKFEIIEFVRLCVKAVYSLCLYCNHARRIAVSGHSLVLHLLAQHRFSATVDSITAEELLPATIVSKLKSFLPHLEEHYFNLESYSTLPREQENINTTNNPVAIFNERIFECFQCRFSTRMHKDLYLHNRKMHLKTAILCFMCRANFFSFSEILCHICPGAPNKATVFDIKFRCCLCEVDGIPSPFRLMVHLRKKHFACDICLEDCHIQSKLSSHVWKHKLHHLCYRCGIAYRNKMDITKHLFWKHGTESIICKRCLQKRWRHVYHFCVPPSSFNCDVCSLCFSKATYLKVHQREHTGDFRYPCMEDNCEEKFISRKLLLKHSIKHAPPPPEIKPEEENIMENKPLEEGEQAEVKKEDILQQEENMQPADKAEVEKEDNNKISDEKKLDEEVSPETSSKKKKKRSRNKESLEDLNLIAPNLSESDSSGESDTERSKTDDKDSTVANVMLSSPSDEEKDDDKTEESAKDTGKILDIWENFKSYQASQQSKKDENDDDDDVKSFTDSDYPTPILHVAVSDHDYCAMYKKRPRAVTENPIPKMIPDESQSKETTSDIDSRMNEIVKRKEESISPMKKKRNSTGSQSSSSGSSSDSSSRSSCSCKTNCSCSSSSSGSDSSSSSEDSDSSTSEGRRRILVKKQERAERNRIKSESSQKLSTSENVDVGEGGDDQTKEPIVPVVIKEKLEPIFIETDLETAESETDEEFYDEHPQKLASQMLAEKRLLLQEQMRLSPSHNFDIVENSRPSTPSLPEEMIKEKKVKLKKKKRDRKSSCKSLAVPPIKLNLSINKVEVLSNEPIIANQSAMQVLEVDLIPPYDLIASPGVAEPPVAQQPVSAPIIQNHTVKPVPFFHTRMSEGSSCSDADNSLKRSQRARRPNKFYGYTSDDENIPGTPLMIGTKTFKPQPPPQLTWRKEDLPTPSKSILLNKQQRTPKTPVAQKGQSKKRVHPKTNSSTKKKQHSLPPIPTLKIRPPKVISFPTPPPPPPPQVTAHQSSYSSSRDETDDTDSSDDDREPSAPNTMSAASVIPTWNAAASLPVVSESPLPQLPSLPPPPPPPPPPQATAFNQKIPPALLPNPDFATIQYFKRNNIRYPIAPPAGARQAREGESVYCYCRCPYDEVSEMIACDGDNCLIEWFHFECVGIMVAPQGKWFCAECRPKYSNELYPQLS